MKICQVICGHGMGGLERHVLDLSARLSQLGHAVTLVACAELESRAPAGVTMLPLRLDGSRYNPFLVRKLQHTIASTAPDIVHAHASKAAHMVAKVQLPVTCARVATIHNLKRQTSAFAAFDVVVGVSRAVTEQLHLAQARTIVNGVEPKPVPPTLEWPHRSGPKVLSVGRLVKAKGFDVLIDAWRDIDVPLAIAGDGVGRGALEKLISRHDLGERVRLLGHRDDVAQLMSACDLLVIASRREGFPYVLIEGLQQRAAIVATRVPGAVDMLPRTYLAPVNDAQALRKCVLSALSDLSKVRADYEPVWTRAASELTLSAMTDSIVGAYKDALMQRADARSE